MQRLSQPAAQLGEELSREVFRGGTAAHLRPALEHGRYTQFRLEGFRLPVFSDRFSAMLQLRQVESPYLPVRVWKSIVSWLNCNSIARLQEGNFGKVNTALKTAAALGEPILPDIWAEVSIFFSSRKRSHRKSSV